MNYDEELAKEMGTMYALKEQSGLAYNTAMTASQKAEQSMVMNNQLETRIVSDFTTKAESYIVSDKVQKLEQVVEDLNEEGKHQAEQIDELSRQLDEMRKQLEEVKKIR